MDNLFERFDDIIRCKDEVIRYADGLCGQLHEAEDHAARKVITTLGYDLGIACPSPLRHIVVGGNKKGKVIGNIPEKDNYQIISYDKDGAPIAFRSGNKFGIKDAYFFFSYNGYTWAVEMNENGCTSYTKLYRMEYDKAGRLLSFYIIENYFLDGEEYTYPEGKPAECLHYYYVPNRSHTAKDVPAGYEGSPMTLYLYLIFEDTIDGYIKAGEEFRFMKTFRRKRSKQKISAEQQFAEQLDKLMLITENTDKKDIYFELHEGSDAEYNIYVCISPNFDPKDENWIYKAETELGEIIMQKQSDMEWEEIQNIVVGLLRDYLKTGKQKDKLRSFAGAAVGFPDGDLIPVKL